MREPGHCVTRPRAISCQPGSPPSPACSRTMHVIFHYFTARPGFGGKINGRQLEAGPGRVLCARASIPHVSDAVCGAEHRLDHTQSVSNERTCVTSSHSVTSHIATRLISSYSPIRRIFDFDATYLSQTATLATPRYTITTRQLRPSPFSAAEPKPSVSADGRHCEHMV